MKKIGRNAPCPCGSGKKYKQCCLRKETPAKALSDRAEPAPARPPPAAFAGMSAYVVSKLFEDSEQFARLKRLEPDKARLFWTPRRVAALSTEDILAKLRALGVDAAREVYLSHAEGRTSAWAIADQWRANLPQRPSRHADDFLGLAACELWRRYCPERPSIEMLDDWMQEGYRLASEGRLTEACDRWWEVWRTIHSRLRPEMKTIQSAAAVFSGTQSLFNWVPDFALELLNAALEERRYGKIGVQLCTQVLAHFPGEDELFQINFRADLGEFHFRIGENAEGERVLLELIRDHPDRAAGYAHLANFFGYGPAPDSEPVDRRRARELLEQALARPVSDAADYDLELRLAELREQPPEPQDGATATSD